jgi:tetratricopeptide (TPR) repeat protein
MARSTVSRYKSRQDDPQGVGRDLHVDAVLTGRVAKRGNEFEIEAELVNAANGTQFWGERYTRVTNDVSLLQAAITSDVASQIRPRLSEPERESLAKVETHDPEAYQLYLKGRYHTEKWTKADFNAGVECFRQAIDRDPNYAAAYAGLSTAYALADDFFMSPNDSMPKSREMAKKALQLDESLSEAHLAMALVEWGFDYDWSGAEREYGRAIELTPRNSQAHQSYSWFLAFTGKLQQSIEESRRGLELDPLSLEANTSLGWSFYFARRYDQAVKQFRTTVEMEPNYWFPHMYLGLTYEQQGDLAGALEELQKASRLESEITWPLAYLGHGYARLGRKSEAEQVLRELTARMARSYVPAYNLATVYVGLDRKEQALTLLEKAHVDRSMMLPMAAVDPKFDSLRSDPRYRDLLRRMGLPQ